ncbi:hypothetical protein M3I54_01155 [Paraburkholderia sp. CNPSo 3274]|uniref:hypothetical protein n=1 Tax=Paraburkholderia sp. CNPSo 3274 TaxID=2940932 RepID=UPI0020B889B4|nr:hypothetical protein [Paraburkholderia sp. CNPSo 3274]MCP3705612.1 hypothetical protein [Paraburkholderia sp. CNPSo 3274]
MKNKTIGMLLILGASGMRLRYQAAVAAANALVKQARGASKRATRATTLRIIAALSMSTAAPGD